MMYNIFEIFTKKGRIMKKFIAILLTATFIFSAFISIVPTISYAASYSVPSDKTVGQVLEKIEELADKLEGKYFTTTGTTCSNSSCTKCRNSNVFESDWFKELFGNVSTSQIPGHAYPNGGSGYPTGWSCHGFANFAFWYVFADDNSSKVTYERVADDVQLTKENLDKYAKPGDIIRTSAGHSMMFISASENSYKVLDNNARCAGDGYNRVRVHDFTYKNVTMSISRASNYVDTPTLEVVYNANGGEIFGECIVGFNYKVTSESGLSVRNAPGTSNKRVAVIPCGGEFYVSYDEVSVSDGYVWGRTTYGNYSGWAVISDFVEVISPVKATEYCLGGTGVYMDELYERYVKDSSSGEANGIPSEKIIGYNYKVTSTTGLSLRSDAGTSNKRLVVVPYKAELYVSVDEVKVSDGYTWGKTTYGSYSGWVVISDFVEVISPVKEAADSLDNTDENIYAIYERVLKNASFTVEETGTTDEKIVGYNYKVTYSAGLSLRSDAGTSNKRLTVIPRGAEFYVSANEIKYANGYTWGKTTYGDYVGWAVISDFTSLVGTKTIIKTNIEAYAINKTDTYSVYTEKFSYGKKIEGGLKSASDFGLVKDGYKFMGWSTTPEGTSLIPAETEITPENIKALTSTQSSGKVTLFAIWG